MVTRSWADWLFQPVADFIIGLWFKIDKALREAS
jgi:hypothetical protein